MSKIVCDICGTTYQDNAGSCPVCGWNQNGSLGVDEDELDLDYVDAALQDPAPADDAAQKNIFDFDAVNTEFSKASNVHDADETDDDEDEEEEESGSNTVLIIILVLLIIALLGVSAFIGWKKIIEPRRNGSDTNKPQETVSQVIDDSNPTIPDETIGDAQNVPTETVEETQVSIPCVGLSMAGGVEKLTELEAKQRFMVRPDPADTTDRIIYSSGDESIVTIDEYGTVTAVGEGETVLIATCGDKRIETAVVVSFAPETTEAPTEAAAPAETTPAAATPAETGSSTSTGTLKLKKYGTEFSLGSGYYVDLEFEGDIPVEKAKWRTSDSSIANVFNGRVTGRRAGTAVITAEYEGQKIEIVVRVK